MLTSLPQQFLRQVRIPWLEGSFTSLLLSLSWYVHIFVPQSLQNADGNETLLFKIFICITHFSCMRSLTTEFPDHSGYLISPDLNHIERFCKHDHTNEGLLLHFQREILLVRQSSYWWVTSPNQQWVVHPEEAGMTSYETCPCQPWRKTRRLH